MRKYSCCVELIHKLHFPAPDAYKSAQSVALYLSMGDEICTAQILEDVFKLNKKCYIPKYYKGSNRMDMVRLRDMEDYDNLPVTDWNIKQPGDDDVREEALDSEDGLDLILIPGLAFTKTGARCGRGKGYYDTYLDRANRSLGQPPMKIGLAFHQQMLAEIPTDDHDIRLDLVLHCHSENNE